MPVVRGLLGMFLFWPAGHAEATETQERVRAALAAGNYAAAEQVVVSEGRQLEAAEVERLRRSVTWSLRVNVLQSACATGKGILYAAGAGTVALVVCNVLGWVLPTGLLSGPLTGIAGFIVGNRYGGPAVSHAFTQRALLRNCRDRLASLGTREVR